MPDIIPSIFNLIHIFLIWFLYLTFHFFRYREIKRVSSILFLVMFLICSTRYVPSKLMFSLERDFPIQLPANHCSDLYIHVFGSGYVYDTTLSPLQQLGSSSKIRLIEGVRLMKQYPNAILVTSGYSKYGIKSQAEVAKEAAVSLGISSSRILVLTTPYNTRTEIDAFAQKTKVNAEVIAVSDAFHLSRIRYLYQSYPHLTCYYSSANYMVKNGVNNSNGFCFPNLNSLDLMNQVLTEKIKFLKERVVTELF